jgi:type V secretory pathway adhesin AidA
MRRHPPLTIAFILARLRVDVALGRVHWVDATKHHRRLEGSEAGYARSGGNGKSYWVVKLNGIQYLRSQIVFAVKTGAWPTDLIDHENGNSLDDRGDNLRPATQMQNAWNHKGRAKASLLPMGVRATRSGRYQARIQVDKKPKVVGVFDTPDAAQAAYQLARKEHFGDYA